MVSFKALSVLAIAGSTVAAPARGYGGHKKVVWETVVHTEYITIYPGHSRPTPSSSSVVAVPTTTVVYQAPSSPAASSSSSATPIVIETPKATPEETPVVTPTPSSTTPAPVYQQPTPTPAPAPVESPVATPSNTGYMAIVDEWRGKLGLKNLIHDDQLEANAIKTCREGNGQMVHQLNPGSMGQVLAPGGPDDFYHVFVGGWLCEKPNMPGMNGVCAEASKGWYYTSTGHADILTSPSYSKIGCGEAGGIWGCDLA